MNKQSLKTLIEQQVKSSNLQNEPKNNKKVKV